MKWLKGLGVALAVAGAATGIGATTAAAGDDHRWGGIYIGASVGGATSDIDWTYPNGTKPAGIDHSEAVLGGHVGIQTQWNRLVLGVEMSYSGTHAFGDNSFDGGACPNAAFQCLGRANSFFTVGPRLGWAVTDNWMIYATGGYASGRLETLTRDAVTGVAFDSTASRHDGWFIGGGIEYALTQNLIIGAEYQHLDLDARNVSATPFFATEIRNGLGADVDIVRARLSFKLGRPEEKHESMK